MADDFETKTIETDSPEAKALTDKLADLSVGYVVGLTNSGDFVFEVLGEHPGLVQLMGLHQYAAHRVQIALEMNQGVGTPLLAGMLDNLQKMVNVLLKMNTATAANDFSKKIIKP